MLHESLIIFKFYLCTVKWLFVILNTTWFRLKYMFSETWCFIDKWSFFLYSSRVWLLAWGFKIDPPSVFLSFQDLSDLYVWRPVFSSAWRAPLYSCWANSLDDKSRKRDWGANLVNNKIVGSTGLTGPVIPCEICLFTINGRGICARKRHILFRE